MRILSYNSIDKGLTFQWDKEAKVRIETQILIKSKFVNAHHLFQPLCEKNIDPSEWLNKKCSKRDSAPNEL